MKFGSVCMCVRVRARGGRAEELTFSQGGPPLTLVNLETETLARWFGTFSGSRLGTLVKANAQCLV